MIAIGSSRRKSSNSIVIAGHLEELLLANAGHAKNPILLAFAAVDVLA